ncbi:CaiB/BaiF CoA transferase family protein [Aquisediminimonas profunda]|uniref:CaiB/BaiF CoA transferase family protein n=1 Tax=Aquisediminimonas profunda TaxID=1550733 RepID=UPI001C63AB09|nr:CaiB/BaiF CoA-transferase family protein [Aquisediminimonas profunda]
MAGVLEGVTIIEMEGIGPAPFCGMMLADHGARVIRVARQGSRDAAGRDVLSRNRERIEADLKSAEGIAAVRELARTADGIIEGFRPGVMERLGLGPDVLLGDNAKLVYGRMTGWGQFGPLAQAAGHDINYISISGNLHGYGRPNEKPTPPTNAIGDFAGGGMMLSFGMVAGILNARSTGKGQVIDCAMTEGAAVIHAMQWGFRGMGTWEDTRGVNMLDTAAHFYDTYECADGTFISIGSIEPQFYALLREKAGLTDPAFDAQMDKSAWPALKAKLTSIFKSKPRAEWCALMEGTDVCFAPVLSMADALKHPHNVERGTFMNIEGIDQPGPAPRFLGTPAPKPVGRK